MFIQYTQCQYWHVTYVNSWGKCPMCGGNLSWGWCRTLWRPIPVLSGKSVCYNMSWVTSQPTNKPHQLHHALQYLCRCIVSRCSVIAVETSGEHKGGHRQFTAGVQVDSSGDTTTVSCSRHKLLRWWPARHRGSACCQEVHHCCAAHWYVYCHILTYFCYYYEI